MRELPERIELTQDVIHVVRARLDCVGLDAGELLDEAERTRADRLVDRINRARFIASHAVLRLVLARFLNCSAGSLRFDAEPGRKPSLVSPASPLRFSLSHSGDRALVAVASGADIGVDIEQERDADVLPLARRFFTAREAADLAAVAPAARRAAFFRIWTRKEAVVKATGDGLRLPLSSFHVGLHDEPARVDRRPEGEAERRIWRVVPLEAEPGYAAALAAADGEWRPREWTFAGSPRAIR